MYVVCQQYSIVSNGILRIMKGNVLSMFFMFSVIWENVCKAAREPEQSITVLLTY